MEHNLAKFADHETNGDGKTQLSLLDVFDHGKNSENLASLKLVANQSEASTPGVIKAADAAAPAPAQGSADAPVPAPTPPADAPPAPGQTPTDTTPSNPSDPLPPVTDSPDKYFDFNKVYVGDNLKLSFQKLGNNIIATGTIAYDKEHTYPFQIATDNYGMSRGGFKLDWTLGDGTSVSCPFPMEINYVSKEVINVSRPDSIWITHTQDDANCPSDGQFQSWKLTHLSQYVEPPPPPPPPPAEPKPDKPKPDHPSKKKHK